MRFFVFIFIVLWYTPLSAQYNNQWILGNAILDFNTNPPGWTDRQMPVLLFGEARASVCDEQGQLLFATEGYQVIDRNSNPMPNGVGLSGGFGTTSCTQGALIVPIPGQKDQYYVFSLTSIENEQNAGRLYRSRVDMRLNNGLGDVVASEKSVLVDSGFTESLIAVTGDQCNIWVVLRFRADGTFRSYEITDAGMNALPVISPSGIVNHFHILLGALTPSPDNRSILACSAHPGGGGIETFEFDRFTGRLSNPRLVDTSMAYYSGCFSPDGSKVYAMPYYLFGSGVYQFDLRQATPSESRVRIAEGGVFEKINLGPDGKVYFRYPYATNQISVIPYPNQAGFSCGLVSAAFTAADNVHGNFPNVISFVRRDTASPGRQQLDAPCFASVGAVTLQPLADSMSWGHEWSDGSNQSFLEPVRPGTYWVRYYTPPCRLHTDTFHLSFPGGILPAITTTASCPGASNGQAYAATYPGDTVAYRFTWFRDSIPLLQGDTLRGISQGAYRVRVQTPSGCDTFLSFYIGVEDVRVAFTVSDTLACEGDTLYFRNTSSAYFTQFLWDFDDRSTGDGMNEEHVFQRAGQYRVRLTGAGAVCQDTAYAVVVADAQETLSYSLPEASACAGQALSFLPDSGRYVRTLAWYVDGQLLLEAAPEPQWTHAFAAPGIFPVTLRAAYRACPESNYADTVHIYGFPKVNLGPDSSLCMRETALLLRNWETNPEGDYYSLWNTGDTSEMIRVAAPGNYALTLVHRKGKCAGTASIVLYKGCVADIPNAFSPNGDGYNDHFFPRPLLSREVLHLHFVVRNRWGQVVFETRATEGRGWDGTFNGKPQPEGSYMYQVALQFRNGEPEAYQGNVTLLR